MKTDVAVVGGGPAGCFFGKSLAQKGVRVTILEEHAEIGNPSCCAGVVGIEGLKELGIKIGRWEIGKIKKAAIFPPFGSPVELGMEKPQALLIDRPEFDRSMATEAVKAGATILLKTKCVDLKLGRKPILKLRGATTGELTARLVVGADGPTSLVARRAGLWGSGEHLRCAQVEVSGEIPKGVAQIYLGREFFPGFFGWAFKAGNVCKVGLGCIEGEPSKSLKNFLKKHPMISERVDPSKVFRFCTDIIPEPFSRGVCYERTLLVGDAAGQVKPLTRGGLYTGLWCSRIAAEVAFEAVEKSPTEKILREYERRIKQKFGLEVELATRARRAFEKMSDEDMAQLVKLLEHDDVKELVKRNFEFDHHGKLIRALIPKIPKIMRETGARRLLRYVKTFIK